MSLPVVVVGAEGRMGRFACEFLRTSSEFELDLCIGSERDLKSAVSDRGGALGLDLTRAGLGFAHGMILLEAGLRPVIGTSGVTPAEVERLDRRARELGLGGIVVPNFSLGMWALQEAAERIAKSFEALEIIEMHSPEKRDAPSATALDTARRLAAVPEVEDAREIPIHSVRLRGVMARQELIFGAEGERLTLSHEVLSRAAYGPGIRLALHFAARGEGVAHGLRATL